MTTDRATDEVRETPHVRPWWAPWTLAAFAFLVICGYIGTAVAPTWANDHPEGLLLLHSRIRHLLLALGGDISPVWYVVIATLRLSLAYAVCHLIGRAYGPDILDVFGKYLGATKQQIEALDDGIRRLEWLLIPVFVGSNIMAAITGIQRLPVRRLAVYVLVGIAGRLLLYWWIAQIFDDELDRVLDLFNRYRWPALIVSVGLVVITIAFNLRRGRGFQR